MDATQSSFISSDTQKLDIQFYGIIFPDNFTQKAYISLCDEQKVSIDLHNLNVESVTNESKYYNLSNEFYPEIETIKKGLNRMEEIYMKVKIGNNIAYYECFSFFYNHPKSIENFYQGSEIVNINGVFLCIDSKTMEILDNKYCYFVRHESRKNKYSHIAVIYSDKSIIEHPDIIKNRDSMNHVFFGAGFLFESNDDIKKIRVDKIKFLNGEIKNVVVPLSQSHKDKDKDKEKEKSKKQKKLDFIKLKEYVDKELEEFERQTKELELLLK